MSVSTKILATLLLVFAAELANGDDLAADDRTAESFVASRGPASIAPVEVYKLKSEIPDHLTEASFCYQCASAIPSRGQTAALEKIPLNKIGP